MVSRADASGVADFLGGQDFSPEAPVVFLTGAGISAESGIPTFRGPEGYWRVGSRNYQPMELATRGAFDGLHLRAGQSPARLYQIHGNIDDCRSARGAFVAGNATALVPEVVAGLGQALGPDGGSG